MVFRPEQRNEEVEKKQKTGSSDLQKSSIELEHCQNRCHRIVVKSRLEVHDIARDSQSAASTRVMRLAKMKRPFLKNEEKLHMRNAGRGLAKPVQA